jgi:hypothetical protein
VGPSLWTCISTCFPFSLWFFTLVQGVLLHSPKKLVSCWCGLQLRLWKVFCQNWQCRVSMKALCWQSNSTSSWLWRRCEPFLGFWTNLSEVDLFWNLQVKSQQLTSYYVEDRSSQAASWSGWSYLSWTDQRCGWNLSKNQRHLHEHCPRKRFSWTRAQALNFVAANFF